MSAESQTKQEMKSQLTLSAGAEKSAIKTWLENENMLLTSIMEEKVTNKQAVLIAHVGIAFTVLICSTTLLSAAASIAWFSASIYLCKKGGLR
jgi:hypothetical protein